MNAASDDETRAHRARSFGRLAADYDRIRPGYPAAAIAALPGGPVVDVGAGTGKLTRALVAAGHRVVAVEPDPGMRAVLVGHDLPGVEVYDGVGERLPVPDGAAASVVYGQAWHWVDPDAASAEARRVLGPDGLLALLWNLPDLAVDWVAELNRISGQPEPREHPEAPVLPGFGPPEVIDTRWSQELTPDELVLLFSTFSRVSTREPADRQSVLERLRDHLARSPVTAGRATLDYPYRCLTLLYRELAGKRT
ncbi:class I SAM-dependent methyltransferase [Actinomycetospora endophytica]|uniref:Class I SAM-dependent methyltransferase n=1 Tax=Actinomycetospora endophytica TaxID=2291215 RepID=A0ABS8PBP2_9PSEU|nr:class I SAM-dependent methyltransferase [Actinomycetospora endophytica]MCD2195648.1 class I SAM-dependent methyltransferase [Actinomycetospora endophytica]